MMNEKDRTIERYEDSTSELQDHRISDDHGSQNTDREESRFREISHVFKNWDPARLIGGCQERGIEGMIY
jgi:hypothetical protein